MNFVDWLGLGLIGFFLLVFTILWYIPRKRTIPLHWNETYEKLQTAIQKIAAEGTRLHFTLGRAGIMQPEGAASIAALGMLQETLSHIASLDRPPIITSGEGVVNLLGQTIISKNSHKDFPFQDQDASAYYIGGSSLAYIGGILPIILEKKTSANVFFGHFGSELGLLMDAGDRRSTLALAGTDDINGQAVLYSFSPEPLLGEDMFSSRIEIQKLFAAKAGIAASMKKNIWQISLEVQHILRWVIILIIMIGIIARFAGLL